MAPKIVLIQKRFRQIFTLGIISKGCYYRGREWEKVEEGDSWAS